MSSSTQPNKRQKLNPPHSRPNQHKPAPKPNPINPLKSRLRSLTRLLSNKGDELPIDQRLGVEREITSLRNDITRLEQREHRSNMISKWHKIRFFDRRKAERRLGKAKRDLSEAAERDHGVKDEEEEVRKRELDLKYTLYFPLEQNYVRLYAKREGDEETVERSNMWKTVEVAAKMGKLDELRDGRWLPLDQDEAEVPQDGEGDGHSLSKSAIKKSKTDASNDRKRAYDDSQSGKQRSNARKELQSDEKDPQEESGSEDDGAAFFE